MKTLSLSHKLSILLCAIASGWLGSIDIVSANPNVFKIDRAQTTKSVRNVKLVGNFTPNDPAGLSFPVYQTACSNIKVSLKRDNKTIASTQAVGSTISNGCSYDLNTGALQLAVAGQFQVAAFSPASGNYGIEGSGYINPSFPFPSSFDFSVSKYYSGPK